MRANTIVDFWTKVKKQPGCWIWLKSKDQDGYGLFNYGGRQIRATRFVAKVILGLNIEGKEIRHTCDNPSCIKPEHLLVGTTKQNAEDRETRGRGMKGRKQSADHVAKKAAARRGKKWTPEMKLRMSLIKRGSI